MRIIKVFILIYIYLLRYLWNLQNLLLWKLQIFFVLGFVTIFFIFSFHSTKAKSLRAIDFDQERSEPEE